MEQSIKDADLSFQSLRDKKFWKTYISHTWEYPKQKQEQEKQYTGQTLSIYWNANQEIWNLSDLSKITTERTNDPKWYSRLSISNRGFTSDLFNGNNQDFVIVVDYYSKYWEIERLYDTIPITIVKKMKKMFSRLGISETPQSGNGPQYTAQVFKEFSKEWNIKHVTSSPEYPK